MECLNRTLVPAVASHSLIKHSSRGACENNASRSFPLPSFCLFSALIVFSYTKLLTAGSFLSLALTPKKKFCVCPSAHLIIIVWLFFSLFLSYINKKASFVVSLTYIHLPPAYELLNRPVYTASYNWFACIERIFRARVTAVAEEPAKIGWALRWNFYPHCEGKLSD